VENTNGSATLHADFDKKSISSLDPRPPTPSSPHLPNHQIDLPPNSAEESTKENVLIFQSKRLCERWLDNLFMVLYEVHAPESRLT
jgi:hypothetical protein